MPDHYLRTEKQCDVTFITIYKDKKFKYIFVKKILVKQNGHSEITACTWKESIVYYLGRKDFRHNGRKFGSSNSSFSTANF